MRFHLPLFVLAASAGCLVLGSGPASALSIDRSDDAVTVNLTDTEARMIDTLNLGPVLGALPPNFTAEAKQRLGENIGEYAGRAAQEPGSTLSIIIDQPIAAPPGVGVTVTR
ncbi:hypothetical protein [Nocardia sp. NBC_01329]|uniref:hypothetical protein n=1 Tax=Nocardia sp. NBC_01329 TaxID=2903594 RepID=UPI002E0D4972|nr:hypothetical protein OG405_22255 [Nocardia sp. NBC_01329]